MEKDLKIKINVIKKMGALIYHHISSLEVYMKI
jgi:hypothetical protein